MICRSYILKADETSALPDGLTFNAKKRVPRLDPLLFTVNGKLFMLRGECRHLSFALLAFLLLGSAFQRREKVTGGYGGGEDSITAPCCS